MVEMNEMVEMVEIVVIGNGSGNPRGNGEGNLGNEWCVEMTQREMGMIRLQFPNRVEIVEMEILSIDFLS